MSSSFSGEEVFESEYRANNWAWDVPDAVLVLLPNKTDDTMMAAKCPQLNQYEIPGFLQPILVWILDGADFLACLLLGISFTETSSGKGREIHQPMSPRCVAT